MEKRWTDLKMAASIAFTHMRAKRKQTIIAMIGVAFGITTFIFMLGLMKGSQRYTEAMVFAQSPHVHLYNEIKISDQSLLDESGVQGINIVYHRKPVEQEENLRNGLHALQIIRQDKRVRNAAPSLSTQVFYRLGAISINGEINGINYEATNQMFQLGEKLIDGNFKSIETIPNSLVMGIGLAQKLNVETGDQIELTTQAGKQFTVKIAGLFKTGIIAIDNNQSYASLKTVQRFLGKPSSYITDIKANLFNNEIAPEVSMEFQEQFEFSGSDWKKDNATFLQGYVLQNMIAYGVAIVILLVAGFGIFNILTMMIYEKMKDIAILKATGFSDQDVKRIFMTQALFIGLVGAIAGLIFGYLAAYGLSQMPYHSDVMISMDHLPVSFNPAFYITGFIFGIVTTAIAGWIPSRKAAKVDPITILRD